MKYEQKQNEIEQKTYNIIDELADEFELNVPFYPEVNWIGRKIFFECLGLPEEYKDEFDYIKKRKKAIYFSNEKVMAIATDDNAIIAEEAGHFLHYENSGIDPQKIIPENPLDSFSLDILVEAIGFFSSKLIDYNRKRLYPEFKDFREYVSKTLEKEPTKDKELEKKVLENAGLITNFFTYKHGYDLGEELFNHYISEKINKKQIRNLFKNSFKEPFSATDKFRYLSKKLMRYSYLNEHAKLNGHPKTLKINPIIV